jgi:hypothetical protein
MIHDVIQNDNVRICMDMSKKVYSDASEHSLAISGKFDGQAIITETKCGKLVIAFRGTESCTDWFVNMMRYRRRFHCIRGALVHSGFLLQHMAMWDEIIKHLSPYMDRYNNILVTGHSLGGALATLFSARFACLHPELSVSCYTFGTPRVGNIKFVEGMQMLNNLSILRVNNVNDVVTWVPFCGFVHTTDVIHIPVTNLSWYEGRSRHSIKRMNDKFIERSSGLL